MCAISVPRAPRVSSSRNGRWLANNAPSIIVTSVPKPYSRTSEWHAAKSGSAKCSGTYMMSAPLESERATRQQAARVVISAVGPLHILRWSISFLVSAMALAGLRSLGQVAVQFMMVWQR